MMNQIPFIPKRALLSVSDKRGIVELATCLHEHGVELVATGNTAALLKENGLPITDVSACTGFPELLRGRVKTLHPAIHGGLLATPDDEAVLKSHHLLRFDLLVVNVYPFESVTQHLECTLSDAIEHIDIGGPAMIRAAAKNYEHIAVVVTPEDYPMATQCVTKQSAPVAWQFELAKKAFAHTTSYDAAISNYLNSLGKECPWQDFPDDVTQRMEKQSDLRYGENPHQHAALYCDKQSAESSIARAELIQGKPLSYNNLLDADAAWGVVKSFTGLENLCVIVKHGNPCGIACRNSQLEAYVRAYETDPTSSYGGILAFNQCVEVETVVCMFEKQFMEVIIAPSISIDAQMLLKTKENIRVLLTGSLQQTPSYQKEVRSIDGGFLIQDRDLRIADEMSFQVVTKFTPTAQKMKDLVFAWCAVKQVKSNAIVLVKDEATIGIGAGQTSRVMSTRIALWQAEEARLPIEGAVMASDAFIPFSDSIELAHKKGVVAIIQPGGSIRDEQMIHVANEMGLVMVFTGVRHFKH